MSNPREWWIARHENGNEFINDGVRSDPSLPEGRYPLHEHVIEYAAYKDVVKERDEVRAKYEELISYMPKVPTESYEKQLMKEITMAHVEMERLKKIIEEARMVLDQTISYDTEEARLKGSEEA